MKSTSRWARSLGIALSVLAVGTSAGCSNRVPIESPPPITAAATPDLTEQAVLDALPRRGWTVEEMKPGEVTAFLSVRDHWLRVSVRYDNAKIVIFYLDSDNLAYLEKNGQPYIHKAWRKWTHNLAHDISRAIKEREAEGLATAPPASGGEQPAAAAQPPAVQPAAAQSAPQASAPASATP